MRVHGLRMTAFGPFAGRVDIDVDALSEHGLFLLTGPTGAGKTSVLDAICFGLYGRVPGARQQADRLHSDHADPGVAPEVQLDVTLAGRRLRLTRSPRWQRPSSRARSGHVVQQASVLAQERVGDGWTTLSTRIDETQHLVDELLGMTCEQFTQVAMLPQGQFQEFLRAGADDRRKVLEQLFGTQRFRDVELWLVEHRRTTAAAATSARQAACSAADQLRGAGHIEEPVPDDLLDWQAWADAVVSAARHECDDLSVLVGQSCQQRDEARRAQGVGAEVASLQQRGLRAHQVLADVAATQGDADQQAEALRAADRARQVTVLLEPLAEAAARVAAADPPAAIALTDVSGLLPHALDGLQEMLDEGVSEVSTQRLSGWLSGLDGERSRHEQASEREQRLALDVARAAVLDSEAASAGREAAEAEETVTRLRTESTDRPAAIDALRTRIDTDRRLDATHDHLHHAVHSARQQADAANRLPAVDSALRAAEDTARQAIDTHQAAVDHRLNIARRRLAGAAAELASRLIDGRPCDVCGSAVHPDPAVDDSVPLGDSDEAAAERAETDAAERRARATSTVQRAQADVTETTAAAGGFSTARADAHLVECANKLEQAAAARARLPGLLAQLANAEQEQARAGEQVDDAKRLAAELRATAAGRRDAWSHLHTGLVDALGPAVDIAAAQQHTQRSRLALEAAIDAVAELLTARAAHETVTAQADRLARRHEFADAQAAQACALDATSRNQLQSALSGREQQAAGATEVLADPAVRNALAAPDPNIEQLTASAEAADNLLDRQRGQLASAERTSARLIELRQLLTRCLAQWQPRHEAHAVAASLATLAEGKSADNHQQMSLSSYVLAARLEQVVAAANERLVPMTSSRYVLEHTVQRSAGDRRSGAGGLGLRIRDEWTGDLRDPSTLSGGETFQTSLALALGLADVVGNECGGTQLQTIFVDEGFGSLDADSLDEVLDELDRLRDGGRVVGVVSHVDAMRERIPTQLHLVKTRAGSSLARTG